MTPNRTNRVLAAVALLAFAFGLVGCNDGNPRPPRVKVSVAGKKGDKDKPPAPPAVPQPPAQPDEPVQANPPEEPTPPREKAVATKTGPQPAIRLAAIRSGKPHPTKEQALADALTVARIELMKHLELLDPPVQARPTMVTMRSSYLKGEIREILPTDDEKKVIRSSGLNANVRWVEIDLELSEDQVQRLRSSERVTDAFRVAALAFALVAALYGFLRLDQWTKGYLTLWLGLGAGVAVVVVGLVVFS
jgi:hypothetical protein